MFNIADKEDLCQISMTGMRALILYGLLMESPHSLKEIRNRFIEYNLIEPKHSDDILRIDLNISFSRADVRDFMMIHHHKYSLLIISVF
mgnify:CR=1 FL=1